MKHKNPNPFALSLSKGRSWFDKLTTNGFLWVWMYFTVFSDATTRHSTWLAKDTSQVAGYVAN